MLKKGHLHRDIGEADAPGISLVFGSLPKGTPVFADTDTQKGSKIAISLDGRPGPAYVPYTAITFDGDAVQVAAIRQPLGTIGYALLALGLSWAVAGAYAWLTGMFVTQ